MEWSTDTEGWQDSTAFENLLTAKLCLQGCVITKDSGIIMIGAGLINTACIGYESQ